MNPTSPPDTNPSSLPDIQQPLLYRIALAYVIRQVRKHPHTLATAAINFLAGSIPLPPGAPWLFRKLLQYVKYEADRRPESLLARAVAELKAAAEEAASARA